MWNKIVELSIKWKLVVINATVLLVSYGIFSALTLPVDIFPDLTAPTVTVITEAHGMATKEVEALITLPVESSVNGATGVRRVRSSTAAGISIVWVEFDWDMDVFIARQIVNEKLQTISGSIPEGADQPVLAPISSIMGEVMLIGMESDSADPMDVRSTADYVVRRRLLSVPGVSQVVTIGGEVKQYQIMVSPGKLMAYHTSLFEVLEAARELNLNSTGGTIQEYGQEYIIRGMGRIPDIEAVKNSVIKVVEGSPVLIGDVASVRLGGATKIGDGAVDGRPAVVLMVQKQPNANTLDLTKRIEKVLGDIQKEIPKHIIIKQDIFKQSDFINIAIKNVISAMRDGTLIVIIILFLLLWNIRTTFIAAAAIPVSMLLTVVALKALGITINTMTLGGITIAVGSLVDNAIVFMENIYRRLRENAGLPEERQRPYAGVIYGAFDEIRGSIFMATFINCVVFLPLFFLSGVEGRMLIPLGTAYLVGMLASLAVSLTITPALSAYLLRSDTLKKNDSDSWLVKKLSHYYFHILQRSLRYPKAIISASVVLAVVSLILLSGMGKSFLPEFNEGTLTLGVVSVAGMNLEESQKIGKMVDDILLSFPEVVSMARRTGRAELDEHAQGVNAHEIEVKISVKDRPKDEFLAELRKKFTAVPGTNVTIGQPISHRLDHMLSGTRASIAIKLFGPELPQLRAYADEIKNAVSKVEGLVDLSVEQQIEVPEIKVRVDRLKMAQYGVKIKDLVAYIDVGFNGEIASQILEGDKAYDLVVRLDNQYRDKFELVKEARILTPVGGWIPLSFLADITSENGPNTISRENNQRKIVLSANSSGRDIQSIIQDIDRAVNEQVSLPAGYYIEYGGQFESAQAASRIIGAFSVLAVCIIFLLLFLQFDSLGLTFLVLLNLPLSLIGGVLVLFLTGETLSLASIIGFISLFGIATRNGILLISRFQQLEHTPGLELLKLVTHGAMERLSPILMTALTTGVALLPLALARHETGNEIQSPLALVIIGGLTSATILNLVVLPVLYVKFHRFWEIRPRAKTGVPQSSI